MPVLISDKVYHIYNHAIGSENLFREDDNYIYFLSKWQKYISPIAESYAFCLMPNHFHFLIKVKDQEEIKRKLHLTGLENLSGVISKQFSNLFNSYAKAYNKRFNRRGSLFIRPFKAKEITHNSYLSRIIFYIHHNPIHHGFTNSLDYWPHSSYQDFLYKEESFLNRKAVIDWYGDVSSFKDFHEQPIVKLNKLEKKFGS